MANVDLKDQPRAAEFFAPALDDARRGGPAHPGDDRGVDRLVQRLRAVADQKPRALCKAQQPNQRARLVERSVRNVHQQRAPDPSALQ